MISQYIGRKKNDDAGESASQLLSFSTIFSILIAGMVLIGNEGMLRLMFGKVEDSVMHACITYLRISAYGSKIKVFDQTIPRSVRAAETSAAGKSIFQYDPKSKVAEAYQSLAKEVLVDAEKRLKRSTERSR